MPLKPEESILISKLQSLDEENAILRQQLEQLQVQNKQAAGENEFLKFVISNLAILDQQIKELDEERKFLQDLKDIAFASALDLVEDDKECDDSDLNDFKFPWETDNGSEDLSDNEEQSLPFEEKTAPSSKPASEPHPLASLIQFLEDIVADDKSYKK
jgi:DNA repair ATPase RecN